MDLIDAINNKQLKTAKEILEKNLEDINQEDEYFDTPLICAARKGYVDIGDLILKKNPNINAYNDTFQTALMCAAKNGHLEFVGMLLKYKPEIDIPNDIYETPLMSAIKNGHTEIANLLIKEGANLNAADHQGFTILMHAIEENDERPVNPEIIFNILSQETEVKINKTDSGGRTALNMAARSENHAIGNEIIGLLLKYEDPKVDMKITDGQDRNALHWCAVRNNLGGITLLKKAGADLSAVDRDGNKSSDLATDFNTKYLLTRRMRPGF